MVKDEPEHLCKLFIGGLDYRTTDETLKSHFEKYGEIVDVIVMKDPQTKRSRGFGFVAFSQSYMVDEAQKCRPHNIDGRDVDTKRAVPRDQIGKVETNNCKKLFIGGIKDLSEDEIRDHFSRFGDIVSVALPTDRETQKKRGFAFVEFQDYDAADKASLEFRTTIVDTEVDVKKARDNKDGGRGGGRGGRGGGSSWGGRGGGQSGYGGGQGGYGGGYGGGQGGYGGGYGGGQGGYGGSSGGYGQDSYSSGGGYGGQSQQGGWGGGYSQGGSDSGSAGGWGGGQTSFGSYNQSYGGGPTRSNYGQGGGARSTPYGGGNQSYGSSGGSSGGYNQQGGGGYQSGKRY